MTGPLELILLTALFGWTLSELLHLFWRRSSAVYIGYGIAGSAVILLQNSPAVLILIALLSPIGLLVPMAAISISLRRLGLSIPRFTTPELLVFFIVFLAYILASIGFADWDPYRHGYSAIGAGVVAVALSSYSLLRGHIPLLCAVILAQVLWMGDIGSSNFYDHLGHFTWILILPVLLCARWIKRIAAPLRRAAH